MSYQIKGKIYLAPMAGVTDYAFRSICREMGADGFVSEMVSAKAMHYKDEKTAKLARLRFGEEDTAIQIFGSEPEIMAEAAKMLSDNSYAHCVSDVTPPAIDINMGCPVKKIVSNREGSALMENPMLVEKIVSAVKKATHLPVTVKFRAGIDENRMNCVEIAKAAESGGADALCVHARTRVQMYAPPVRWEYIRMVKEAVSLPVIGNGGIESAEDAMRMYEETGCDAIMIGRGAEGNPFIFRSIKNCMEGREDMPVTPHEIVETVLRQIKWMLADKGEEIAILEARKHIAWYLKGFRGAPRIREAVNRLYTLAELEELLYGVLEQ
ncbi:MAG: tRNA dihydrouridine synthase DusB [Ruminococcaceae bacterium]|nr:tRNA dihydrouridine synthase DusB [Oscillospiraceae bacterium]